jgi:hypothetical protein
VLRPLRIGDHVSLALRRDGTPLSVDVPIGGYSRARVTLVDSAIVSAAALERRVAWLAGR